MRNLLKEPLVHFLGGALLVFGFFAATGLDRDRADYTISIDDEDIDRLRGRWIQSFRRPPSEEELAGLIDQEIAEEVYYREALRLGLDRDDPVIRRRMFTKMRFLGSPNEEDTPPSDSDLQEWMDDHPGKYTHSSSYNLEQIYLGQAADVQADKIQNWLADLNNVTIAPGAVAKSLSLPQNLANAGAEEIGRLFGEGFASALEPLETGQWLGPVESGYGLHLVKINNKQAGRKAKLDDVRQVVTNDWRAARTAKRNKAALDSYREQYDISVAGRE